MGTLNGNKIIKGLLVVLVLLLFKGQFSLDSINQETKKTRIYSFEDINSNLEDDLK